ncbi:TraR/DksA C4-type zinc finger protein [Candidatus Nomurabacteria bacterium]|nr:TraR/DksA C4-type zinc finger protein [Candidatus Nomurabacteria bacterium]USN95138.1 MAG: TraR/DksA C4-type zinc finger protein [Candidatus Nomurabacteria bacterium]
MSVEGALKRIENGTYGTCSVCGEKIEEDRLGANPAADTCKAHMN